MIDLLIHTIGLYVQCAFPANTNNFEQVHCMSVHGNEVVTGSADHSLKCVDIPSGKIKRELYSKKFGHTEWVTAVAHAPDGRVLSGAMDSKLCLWHPHKVQCTDLLGHKGSISQVQVSQDGSNIGLSASYDTTLKVWDLDKQHCVHTLQHGKAHKKAVQTFFWENSLVVSGGKDAIMCTWVCCLIGFFILLGH